MNTRKRKLANPADAVSLRAGEPSRESQPRKVTLADLGMTPEEMEKFAGGARFLIGDGERCRKVKSVPFGVPQPKNARYTKNRMSKIDKVRNAERRQWNTYLEFALCVRRARGKLPQWLRSSSHRSSGNP